jgi:hypothetical protein
MVHLDLAHSDMKPAPIVRYEIERELSRSKQLLVAAVIAATMIVVMAGMFLNAVH